MEEVAALGHHPQHLRILVLAQADRARRAAPDAAADALPREGELGVRIDDARVEPHRRALVRVAPLVVVLGHEDDAGEDDAVGARVAGPMGGRRGGAGGGVVVVLLLVLAAEEAAAGGAAADVGGEEDGGEEDEEAEGDGDGVAEAEVGEVAGGGGGRRRRACGGGGGGHGGAGWRGREGDP